MKKAPREANTARCLYVKAAKNFRPAVDPLPGGAGRPKFNQLEMVTTFTQFGEDRCTQFRVIVVTDPQTHPQTGPITIHCAAKLSAQCKYTSTGQTRSD